MVGAVVAERPDDEAIGSLGLEAGAAVWFGGALIFGARCTTTVLRGLLLVGLAVADGALVAIAVALGWSGATLALAMKLGVGAVTVAAVDIVLLGLVQPRLAHVASAADPIVIVQLNRSWPPATIWLASTAEPQPPISMGVGVCSCRMILFVLV